MNNTNLLKVKENQTDAYTDLSAYLRAYQVEYADYDASNERCAAGNSVRDYIRTVRTIRCTFRTAGEAEHAAIMTFLKKKKLYVAFYDISANTQEEGVQMYPSTTRTSTLYTVSGGVINQEFSIDLIEF